MNLTTGSVPFMREKFSSEKKSPRWVWLILLAGAVAVGVAIKKLERNF